MKNDLILRRDLNVRCWHVSGQVAFAKKRSDLLPVLMRVKEVTKTEAEDIAAHLFFERHARRVVAERLLNVAHRYGLLKKDDDNAYSLTNAGEQALVTERIYVPQEGTWTVWASDDQMLIHPVLNVTEWEEPSAYDEVWGKDKQKREDRPFDNLPSWMALKQGRAFSAVGESNKFMRIDALESKVEPVPNQASLRLEWNVSQASLRLRGKLADQPVDSVLVAPQISTDEVWKTLLDQAGLWHRWDQEAEGLRVSFSESNDSERERLARVLKFKKPQVLGVGTFDDLEVPDVPLLALSAEDAEAWAEWRLQSRVGDYATTARYQQWSNESVEPFAEFSPSLPSRYELAEEAWNLRGNRPTANCWHLVAAEDWGL